MWFKNLALFRFTEPLQIDAAELEQKLDAMRFRPCGSHEEFSFGWTPPLGQSAQQLVHAANGFLMICANKEEKVLPPAVVNELLQERIQEAETQQARRLPKKERDALKDELLFELLPRAFSFSRQTYAYIDPKSGWLIVDAASSKKAEDLASLLRKCLGSLPVTPPLTRQRPVDVMTDWLNTGQAPKDISIENECELRSPEEDGGLIRCKRQDLSAPEIKNHLDTGKQVIKLAVSWADRLSFIVDENLAIKRLAFLDLIQDQLADIETDDRAEQFDAEFSIMSLELANFVPRLLELFGGENES
ncbi:recombination-associated protein RdgC [Thiolapillus sp.]|uniref:recombination-associated protein RdgC n=1 Tax=Thiolapillus sp. TaxID=2017437 RepID=UPI003AF8C3E5